MATETHLVTDSRPRSTKTHELRHWRATVIVDGMGSRQIGKLTVTDCDRFLVLAAGGEYGRRQIGTEALRRIRRLLIDVLRNEMRLGNLARNVAELSVMPAVPTSRTREGNNEDGDDLDSIRRSLTHDEYRQLWRVSRQPLLVVLDLCGRNGLRPSEARALRWSCIDADAMTMTINRQMSSNDHLTQPKTKRARRKIQIDDLTLSGLEGWRAIQNAKRQRAGDRWATEPDLVIATRYGTPINRSNLGRMVTTACEESGISRIVPYELRHTAISHQRHAGRDSAEVADWAGTSERMVNEIYRHRLHDIPKIRPININGLNDNITQGPDDSEGDQA